MPIDLGNNPVGATPTIAQAAQMCTALKVGTSDDVTFNKVGIGLGATGPFTALDVNSDKMCLRQPFTPTEGEPSLAGTMCWDEAGRLYVQTGSSGWKYIELGPIPGASGATGETGASGYIGSTGAFGLLNYEGYKPVEYIPFYVATEELIIRATITGELGASGPAVIILGSYYTPFEYEIINYSSTYSSVSPYLYSSNDDTIYCDGLVAGDWFEVSLKVGDSYLSFYESSTILTPGNTLSGSEVGAYSNTYDAEITFTVVPRT
jgi:hypothetical protein